MTVTDTYRSTDLATIAGVLKDQHARKLDVVLPASHLRVEAKQLDNGLWVPVLIVPDAGEAIITPEGVTPSEFPCTYGNVATNNISTRLDIPVKYLGKLAGADDELALYLENVNFWLRRHDANVLVRTFKTDDGQGFCRAILSDSYSTFDNLDALLAVLAGIKATGEQVTVRSADLTENRMNVRFDAPGININVADLVADYRHGQRTGVDYPLLYAGLTLTNSEVAQGAFQVGGQAVFQVCTNGMTSTRDIFRKIHLGSKLDAGVVKWSEETLTKTAELITSKTADIVRALLSKEWLQETADHLRTLKGITVAKPDKVVKLVAKHLAFNEDQTEALLNHFILGGDNSVLGVGQAITSFAQAQPDGDLQGDLEEKVWSAMAVAAADAR